MNKNHRKLFTFLSLLLMYELGLFFGSIVGKYWVIEFLFTGILSSAVLIIIELTRRNNNGRY